MKDLNLFEIGQLGFNAFAFSLLSDDWAKRRLPLPVAFGFEGVTYAIGPSPQALVDYLSNSLDPTILSLATTLCERDRYRSHLEYTKGRLEGILNYTRGGPVSQVRRSLKETLDALESGSSPWAKRCWCGQCFPAEAKS